MDDNKNKYATGKEIMVAQVKFFFFVIVTVLKNYYKIVTVFLLLLLFIPLYMAYSSYFTKPTIAKGKYHEKTDSAFVTVYIPKGISSTAVLDSLYAKGLINGYHWSKLLLKFFKFEKQFKAGMFDVPDTLNDYATLYYLSNAPLKLFKITVPEGLTYKKIASLISKKGMADSSVFVSMCESRSFMEQLGLNEKIKNLEGYLLADTYFFPYGTSEKEIIRLIVKETLNIFGSDSVISRMKELRMNRHEILTLASIVEGEIIFQSEAQMVSGVYHNRLRKRWKLQADPTIQYILPGAPKRLLYKDLRIDSPYNTYKYYGLPPGPINNPGRNAIMAALYPAKTDCMYFVATGDGHHHFSKTIYEHNRWKRKFNKVRKKIYGK